MKKFQILFICKHSFGELNIVRVDKVEIMTKSSNAAKTSISYFTLVTEYLDLLKWPRLASNTANKKQETIHSFSNHPSIRKIK